MKSSEGTIVWRFFRWDGTLRVEGMCQRCSAVPQRAFAASPQPQGRATGALALTLLVALSAQALMAPARAHMTGPREQSPHGLLHQPGPSRCAFQDIAPMPWQRALLRLWLMRLLALIPTGPSTSWSFSMVGMGAPQCS